MSSEKTIYFIRHGQSEHNVFEEAHCHEPDYKDPNLFDAEYAYRFMSLYWNEVFQPANAIVCNAYLYSSLSLLGQDQVSQLPNSVSSFLESVELVVVSPLSRAIKTCLGAFDPEKVKVLVNCSCREQVSNACDIGSPKSTLHKEYPHLDFTHVMNDVWWYRDEEAIANVTAENYKAEWILRRYEEPHDELMSRISDFRTWLAARPESVIVVVGHSNFFKFFLGMSEKLKNCEVHKFVL